MGEIHERERTPNQQLRRQRDLRGWSRGKMALELQTHFPGIAVTDKDIGRWESGKRRPGPYYREKLCILFQTTADKLGFIPQNVSFEQNTEEGEPTQKQARLRQEFEGMKPQPENMDYTISRRQAIGTLISFPLSLLTTLNEHNGKIAPEEFLPQCAASITACWDALNNGDLALIEQALPRYLPVLVSWSHRQSRYQKMAAYLGAQGSLLMYLVLYHRCRFNDVLAYARQAVALAQISENQDLHVFALIWLGAPELSVEPKESLKWRLQATQHSNDVVLPLQSKLSAELAYSYALNGMESEALESISEARHLFTDDFEGVPHFISSDYGIFQLILFEGLTRLTLGEKDEQRRQTHSEQAGKALAQIETLPSTLFIPQRSKLEIMNQQALAAIWEGNMDDFLRYFLAGVEGAKALGSEKRWQELVTIWRAAYAKWPHEDRILKLSVVLLERQ
jgi:hypothetical protein